MPGQWTRRLGSCLSQARDFSTAPRRSKAKHVAFVNKDSDLGPTWHDGHRTFRKRLEGKKELPLPPLLDPVVLEKRYKYQQKKERPNVADFTPFQRKLWENPFAHALASPVRECRVNSTFLPSDLLLSLHMRPHPTTGHPWLLPVSLTTDKHHLGLPLRITGRQLIVQRFGQKKAFLKGMSPRMHDKIQDGERDKLVWREDMPQLILDLLRKRVVDRLSWNFSFRGRLTPVASPRTRDIDAVDDVSSVLLFRSLRTPADDVQQRSEAITVETEKWAAYFGTGFEKLLDPHHAPGVTHKAPYWYPGPQVSHMQPRVQFPELNFKTTTWRGRKVAVYSLTDLLGPDKAAELISGANSKYADQSCVVIKRARHNVPVEILLMQLQAYIALPGI